MKMNYVEEYTENPSNTNPSDSTPKQSERLSTKEVGIDEASMKSDVRFRKLFERAGIGIFQAKPTGRFISVNSALSRMLGYDTPEDVLANITDISREVFAEPEVRRRILLKADENNDEVLKFRSKCYRKDGTL